MSNWYSGDSQIKWVCIQLLKGREISHRDEIDAVRGWRLAAIIHNLIHKYNWPIISTPKGVERVAYYKLGSCDDKESLKKPRSFYPKKKGAVTPSLKDK